MANRLSLIGLTLLLAVSASHGQQAERGALAGIVRYLDEVPPPQKILTGDGGTLLFRDLLVHPRTRGLRYVSVFVENAPKGEAAPAGPVVVDQKEMQFVPRVVAVQEGRKVRIENNDLSNHAVQAISTLEANTFNVTTPHSQPFTFAFKSQKTPVVLGCPIHGWMRAYVFVHPHPFFAVTDEEGRYRIEGLPPGDYFVVFRHPDSNRRDRRVVTVRPSAVAELNLDWRKNESR